MKKRKIVFVLGMCLSAATLQAGCGGAAKDSAVMESAPAAEEAVEEIMYDNATGMVTAGSSSEMKEMEAMEEAVTEEAGTSVDNHQQDKVQTERKLIRTVDLNLETENYDSLMEGLEQQIKSLGGYIEYKDAYHGNYNSKKNGYRNRHANITARIPANKLDEFTGKIAEIGNITYESESVEDVTLQYVDLSSHKKMLVAEQTRLMELLENADSMEDIITIESRLSEVRYQIESMESQLRTFDNQVDYSTVHINVEEVEHYTPQPEKTTWERMKTGFGENVYRVTNGIKNLGIEFVIAIPILLVWAVVIAAGVILVRIILKKKYRKDAEKLAKKQELFQNESVSEDSNKK